VNNITPRKEKGVSRSKKKSTISKKAYQKMEENWSDKKTFASFYRQFGFTPASSMQKK
jgi:hypothetical protein